MPASKPVILYNARLVDPATGYDGTGSVWVKNGVIHDVQHVAQPDLPEGVTGYDCEGHILSPGLIDMRVFLGEPGARHKESFRSGGEAAVAGGVTTIITQPDTTPVLDEPAILEFVHRRATAASKARVHPMAALTIGMQGQQMTEFQFLLDAGAIGFTDADHVVANPIVFRRCLEYASSIDGLVTHHIQEPVFQQNGVATEGLYATKLGLPGIPAIAEAIMLERDLRLLELTHARYHADMVSTTASIKALRRAKQDGQNVTAGIAATHFGLNELDIAAYQTFARLDPPLRCEDDRMAMEDALAEGLIDVIVSSHRPQDEESKRLPFEIAAVGAVGLETLLSVSLKLYHEGRMSLVEVLAKLTVNPARILKLNTGRIAKGAPADLVVFNLDAPWVVERHHLKSKSKNTPFHKRRLQGRIISTVVAGQFVFGRTPDDTDY